MKISYTLVSEGEIEPAWHEEIVAMVSEWDQRTVPWSNSAETADGLLIEVWVSGITVEHEGRRHMLLEGRIALLDEERATFQARFLPDGNAAVLPSKVTLCLEKDPTPISPRLSSAICMAVGALPKVVSIGDYHERMLEGYCVGVSVLSQYSTDGGTFHPRLQIVATNGDGEVFSTPATLVGQRAIYFPATGAKRASGLPLNGRN